MTLGWGHFFIKGIWLVACLKRTTKRCHTQNMKTLSLVVLKVFHDAPGAWHVWTQGPRLAGFIKRTFIHCYTQNRKALGLVVSEIFLFFPLKAMVANDPCGGAILTPGGMVGRIYKEYHYTLLHTKYERSRLQ